MLTLHWEKRTTRPAFAGHARIDIPIQSPPVDPQFTLRLSQELRRRLAGDTKPLAYIAADIVTTRDGEDVLTLLVAPELSHEEADGLKEAVVKACEDPCS